MLVRDCMQQHIVTVSPDDTLETAIRLTNSHHLRHLPVVLSNGDVVGIVSDRDIRLAMPSPLVTSDVDTAEFLQRTAIAAIMTRDVVTIGPEALLDNAAKLIHRHRIGALPVLDGSMRLVGILTESDILRGFLQLIGVGEPSTRIELLLEDRPGELGRALTVIGDRAGVNVVSVLVPPGRRVGRRRAVLHLATIDPRETLKELEVAGFTAGWPGLERLEEPLAPLPG